MEIFLAIELHVRVVHEHFVIQPTSYSVVDEESHRLMDFVLIAGDGQSTRAYYY